jgi:hypothetical protein
MDDKEVLGRINELAREEHELFERESHGKVTDADRARAVTARGYFGPVLGFAAPETASCDARRRRSRRRATTGNREVGSVQ